MPLTPWKKLSEELVDKNPYWEYVRYMFRAPRGNEAAYYAMRTPGSVVVIGVRHDGRVLMVRQYRPLFAKESMEFPCGGIGADPHPEIAVAREFQEETKHRAGVLTYVGAFEPCSGLLEETSYVFLATELTAEDAEHDVTEEFERMWMTAEEIDECIARGGMSHGMMLAAWILTRERVRAYVDQQAAATVR